MSQIYKVFFNNISFEIKPFFNIESKECCIVFFKSFDQFALKIKETISNPSDNSKNRFILKSNNIKNDWERLINNLKKFDFIVAAGGLVKNSLNEVLFIFKNGIWDLPKGKVNVNEKLHVTAKREVCEECGFQNLEIVNFISRTYHLYYESNQLKLKETHWFLCKSDQVNNLQPQIEEGITKLKWVPEEKVSKVLESSYNSIKELWV